VGAGRAYQGGKIAQAGHLSVNDVYLVLEADLEEKLSAKVDPLFEEITYEERLRLIADVCARFGCTRLEELEAADQEAVAAAIGEHIIEEYGHLFEHLI
jgi:hypothetical protein